MGIVDNALIGASGQGGYFLTRSVRMRASASAYLNRTPASSSSQSRYTLSFWVKRGTLGANQTILSCVAYGNASYQTYFRFNSSDQLEFYNSWGSDLQNLITTQVFRDPSAWYHIVFAINMNGATRPDAIQIYVNGSLITAFSTTTYTNVYQATAINSAYAHNIFRNVNTSSLYTDGYLAEVNFVDGQQLLPSSFGSFNAVTGVWQPARYGGTYGTNGFYLPFTDNSALTTSSNVGLGKDFSGNGNYWTTNNISITAGVTYDSMTDVPTLTSATAANFCVGNPLSLGSNASLSNANLSGTLTGSGGWAGTICGLTSGKWYWEATPTANSGNSMWVGFLSDVYTKNDNAWSYSTQTALYANDGRNGNNASYGATWTTNDVIGIALDLSTSSGSITFYKNGVSQGVMFSSLTTSAVWRPLISGGGTGTTIAMNFGQRPFAYTPPTGYVALNTFNLPTSTIVNGASCMAATLYTGTAATLSVSNAVNGVGFQPDLVWFKSRSAAYNHLAVDSVRGLNKYVYPNLTAAEGTFQVLDSVNSSGFVVNASIGTTANDSGVTYVAWNWKAGQGTTSTNTSGTITSTVSVNASAGFSIATCTTPSTSTNFTVGHGLGVAPAFMIVKNRTSVNNWTIYHQSTGATGYLLFNTVAFTTNSDTWANTAPTSTVWSSNTSGWWATNQNLVAYCWTPIAGYSAFGSYTGNGSADGPFIYTGFRPKFVMIKGSSFVSNWFIEDSARNGYNVNDGVALRPNLSNAEDGTTTYNIDILSNGFKLRSSAGDSNSSGATFVYAAFAETPTKNALAR